MNFREMVRHMAIDDNTMVRHLDALLRDFVDDHRALFGFFSDKPPAESALSKAGWRWFAAGHLRLEQDDGLVPRLELAGDLAGRGDAKLENQPFMALYERLQDAAGRALAERGRVHRVGPRQPPGPPGED
jgi:hypothetical protein